jgi:AcrR family transcriptional regulator
MSERSADTRRAIINAAYVLLRRHGYARVSLDDISAGAQVTKRTLYYHFASKDDLLAAVLELEDELAFTAFQTFAGDLGGTAEDIVDGLFRELGEWSSRPGWAGSGFTRLAMEMADLPGHPARQIARRHKERLEQCLCDRLVNASSSLPPSFGREIMLLLEGAMVMVLLHGDRSYAEAAAGAAKRLLPPMSHPPAVHPHPVASGEGATG